MNDMMPPAKPGMAEDQSSDQGMEDKEPVSIFIPKSALGGKEIKAGDKIPMIVKDLDPETGDVEAVCDHESYDSSQKGGMSEAFDKAMPEEKGGSYA